MALLAVLAVGAGLAVVSATRPVLTAAQRSPLVDR
jgi:hypothetical protein